MEAIYNTESQMSLALPRGVMVIDGTVIPSDDVINSFSNEQEAIDYCIQRYVKRTGASMGTLAEVSGMHKSQISLLWSGKRGIPMNRFVSFVQSTGNAALLKYYAFQLKMTVISKREWNAIVDRERQQAERIAELENQVSEMQRDNDKYQRGESLA